MSLIIRLRSLMRQEEGQDLLEYALLVALIALVAVAAVTAAGQSVNQIFQAIAGETQTIQPQRHRDTENCLDSLRLRASVAFSLRLRGAQDAAASKLASASASVSNTSSTLRSIVTVSSSRTCGVRCTSLNAPPRRVVVW